MTYKELLLKQREAIQKDLIYIEVIQENDKYKFIAHFLPSDWEIANGTEYTVIEPIVGGKRKEATFPTYEEAFRKGIEGYINGKIYRTDINKIITT